MVPIRQCLLCLKRPFSTIKFSTYVGVVDAPINEGQKNIGVAEGPNALREAGLLEKLTNDCAVNLKDYGSAINQEMHRLSTVDVPPNMYKYEQVINHNKYLSKTVENIIKDGRICLTLGGDHSIGLGSVSGHCKARGGENVALVWVDAHADLNTNATSDSGNMHGMPVALLTDELDPYWSELPLMDWHVARLPMKNIAYIGLRSIDPYEEWLIEKLGILRYDMSDVQKCGIDPVITEALKLIDPNGTKAVHLSFDIDALDPIDAPSTGTPVPGGLLLREGIYIASTIYNTGRLGAMDLVEVNPKIGSVGDVQRTVSSAVQVIMAAFGYGRRGVKPGLPDLKRLR